VECNQLRSSEGVLVGVGGGGGMNP
jgi:hypothetical protein